MRPTANCPWAEVVGNLRDSRYPRRQILDEDVSTLVRPKKTKLTGPRPRPLDRKKGPHSRVRLNAWLGPNAPRGIEPILAGMIEANHIAGWVNESGLAPQPWLIARFLQKLKALCL